MFQRAKRTRPGSRRGDDELRLLAWHIGGAVRRHIGREVAITPVRAPCGNLAGVVVLAGSNIVAVRFSNRELEPFWGAGIRFVVASLILWVLVARGRYPLPRGRALAGAVIYGVLSFLLAYAFFYWGSQEVPAGLGGTIMASVPLLTVLLAGAHRLEELHVRGTVGAIAALAGIAVMSSGALSGDVALISVKPNSATLDCAFSQPGGLATCFFGTVKAT